LGFFQLTLILTTVYCVFTLVVKAAILIEFLRIFEPLGRRTWLWWVSYGLIFANAVLYILIIIFLNVACKTVTLTGSCTSEFKGWTTLCSAVLNFVTDVLIIFIPQYGIWKLNLSTRKKLGVAAVFFIGISGTLAAGLRLGFTVYLYQSEDFTYTFSQVVMCCLSEGCCAMLVLCGPTLPRALSAMGLKNPLSSEGSRRKQSKQSSIKLESRPKNSLFKHGAYANMGSGDDSRPDSSAHIIQTTKVETTVTSNESARNSVSAPNVYDRQHPWEAGQSTLPGTAV
jgi:hypothetical protein